MPLTGICLWRKAFNSRRPTSSSPTTPTGRTLTPRSARLLTALAPPPGTTVRSRCFRISTGASRDTREISPKTNSSATRSPSTVTVTLGKLSTIFLRRSVSFRCLVIGMPIFSCPALPLLNLVKHGIEGVSCIGKLHLHRHNRKWHQGGKIGSQIDCIFLGRHKAASLAAFLQLKQLADVFLGIRVVVTIKRFGRRFNVGRSQLQDETLRPRDAAENNRPRWDIVRRDSTPHAPHQLPA